MDPIELGEEADRLRENGEYEAAEQKYREALTYFPTPSWERGQTFVGLANLHAATETFEEASAEYREAIACFHKVESKDPEFFCELQANAWNDYGNLLTTIGSFKEGEKAFRKAIEFYEKLAKKDDSEKKAFFLATTWVNLSELHLAMQAYKLVERELDAALAIFRSRAKNASSGFLRQFGTTLEYKADLYLETDRTEKAEQVYLEAATLYRTLSKTEPEVVSDLARILAGLAVVHKSLNQMQRVEQDYKEVLTIYQTLAKQEPLKHGDKFAIVLNELAKLHCAAGALDQGEQEYRQALKVWRFLVAKAPGQYDVQLATTLNSLGTTRLDLGSYKDAEKDLQEALTIYSALMKEDEEYEDAYAGALDNIASLYEAEGRHADAERESKKALAIFRKLAAKDPTRYGHDLIVNLKTLADAFESQGRIDEVKEALSEAVATCKAVNRAAPGMLDQYLDYFKDRLEQLG